MTWNPMKCATCETDYALTSATLNFLRASGHTFHCPFGHPWVFTERPSEADVLRRERDRLKQETARLEDEKRLAWAAATDEREQREAAERRASAARGQVTKLKKRASAGVCPCCNRQFVDLLRHMTGKHPGFMAEEVTGAPLH